MERTIHPDALKAVFAAIHLIDVRRAADRDASPEQIPGATWHNPELLADWADSLPKDKEIVLYCVRGGSVSSSVVKILQATGLDARFIEGGLEGWKAAGGAKCAKS